MWLSATSSSIVAALVLVVAMAGSASATVLITVDEALAAAFPDAELRRETMFLTAEQLAAIEADSGIAGQSAMLTRFVATRAGRVIGSGYLDTHRVRTLPETILIAVDADGTVLSIEVVSFKEPTEYLPPEPWYAQFEDKSLDAELALKRSIRPITGATLTAVATTDAVRRILAVHRASPPEPTP